MFGIRINNGDLLELLAERRQARPSEWQANTNSKIQCMDMVDRGANPVPPWVSLEH